MITLSTTGSRILDIISQIIRDHSMGYYSEEDNLLLYIERAFTDKGFYIMNPMVEVNLKGYVSKKQIERIAEIVEDFSHRDKWTIAELRRAVINADLKLNC